MTLVAYGLSANNCHTKHVFDTEKLKTAACFGL